MTASVLRTYGKLIMSELVPGQLPKTVVNAGNDSMIVPTYIPLKLILILQIKVFV